MNGDKQIEEMAKSKKCQTCIHNAVCQELEEFRDALGWVSTEGEFVCSYYDNAGYRKASEIFEEIEYCMSLFEDDDDGYLLKKCEFEYFMRELKKKYTEGGV